MPTRPRVVTISKTLLAAFLIPTSPLASQTSPASTTLYTFVNQPEDGGNPIGLAAGSNGVFYGVTASGGLGYGTVFAVTPPAETGGAWTETVLYDFKGKSDGAIPSGIAVGSGPDGGTILYGTTAYGGTGALPNGCLITVAAGLPPLTYSGCGTVFSLTPPASPNGQWTESVLYNFAGGGDGGEPYTGVVIGAGGVLYGTTSYGGVACAPSDPYFTCGVVFSLTPPKAAGGTWAEAVLYSFNSPFGPPGAPSGLAIGSGGVLYGAFQSDNTSCSNNGCGAIYSLTPPKSGSRAAWSVNALYAFKGGSDGFAPSAVSIGSGGVLYGTTPVSPPNPDGTVFSLTPPASGTGAWTHTVLYTFQGGGYNDLSSPSSGVAIGAGGVLYGTATQGLDTGSGGVFSLTPPATAGGAWTETILHAFAAGSDGSYPSTGLLIGHGGVLFGVTYFGGLWYSGTVFSLAPTSSNSAWTETILHAFSAGGPGYSAVSTLVSGPLGVLYGATEGGGGGTCPSGCGTIFSLTPPPSASGAWTFNLLHQFTGGADGAYPMGPLAVGPGGVLYGTTSYGGTGACTNIGQPPGCGVVFSLSPSTFPDGGWTETTLHSFTSANGTCNPSFCLGYLDGLYPSTGVTIGSALGAPLVLYGTTLYGGPNNGGTVFALTPASTPDEAWTENILYNFGAQGVYLYPASAGPSGLTTGDGSVLYGTASYTGSVSAECGGGCGEVFSLTPPSAAGGAWTETAIYSFQASSSQSPAIPVGGVVIGGDGTLYGATDLGPSPNGGLFALSPPLGPGAGWSISFNITGALNIGSPNGLLMASNGAIYGATSQSALSVLRTPGNCTPGELTGCGGVFALIPQQSPQGVWDVAGVLDYTSASGGFQPMAISAENVSTLYGTLQPTPGTTEVQALNAGAALAPSYFGGVVNAANYAGPVAPGSIATAYGDFLLASPVAAGQLPLPTQMGGLTLNFDNMPSVPLFFASNSQVNFQVPWELAGQSQASLTATRNGVEAVQLVNIAPVAPAIFSANATGTGQGVIVNTSYQLVDSANPAAAGSFVSIYCTGLGAVSNQPPTGSPAPDSPPSISATPQASIGGVPANVQFSGLAPGYVGLYQVNVQVPGGAAAGPAVPVMISIGGVESNTVTMAVQ